ncbi:MAG TPA: hypothetical protein PLF31_03000 [Candidatus Paceibacterota bacterium]|nr:hypothetical protein [Candidatus Paceibacterota bacterium]
MKEFLQSEKRELETQFDIEQAEEQKLQKERKESFDVYQLLIKNGAAFEDELKHKYAEEIEDQGEEILSQVIKNKVDSMKLRITSLTKELTSNLISYVNSVDAYDRSSLHARSGPQSPGFDPEKKQKALGEITTADQFRKKQHNKLIDTLKTLLISYQNASLDTSWKSVVGYERYDIQRWAENVRDEMNLQREKYGSRSSVA